MMLPRLVLVQSALCALAAAQTPPNSLPSTQSNLAVTYGSKKVTPGIFLTQTESQSIPNFTYSPASAQQLYTLLLVDLSIPGSRVNASQLAPAQLPVAPGLGANRTTRLHFWQAGLRFASNGTLVNTTTPVAYYNGPSPPAGDIAHAYVFYLFPQQAGFQAPAADSPFNQNNINKNPNNRQSFNVQTFAKAPGVGPLAAANYIQVQNNQTASSTSGAATGTAPRATATATTTRGSSTGSAATFTGAAMKVSSSDKIGALAAGLAIALMGA